MLVAFLAPRERRLPRASTTQGRTALQRIVQGRITFTPRRSPVSGHVDGYEFQAVTKFDKLFSGLAVERPAGTDMGPLGSEGICPEDTFDGDYGRLLDRALENAGKGSCARTRKISNPLCLVGSVVRAP